MHTFEQLVVELSAWVRENAGVDVGADLWGCLQDGVILCQLMARCGFPCKHHPSPGGGGGRRLGPFFCRDNAVAFLAVATSRLGLPRGVLFDPDDLVERRNVRQVGVCLYYVMRRSSKFGLKVPRGVVRNRPSSSSSSSSSAVGSCSVSTSNSTSTSNAATVAANCVTSCNLSQVQPAGAECEDKALDELLSDSDEELSEDCFFDIIDETNFSSAFDVESVPVLQITPASPLSPTPLPVPTPASVTVPKLKLVPATTPTVVGGTVVVTPRAAQQRVECFDAFAKAGERWDSFLEAVFSSKVRQFPTKF